MLQRLIVPTVAAALGLVVAGAALIILFGRGAV